MRPVLIVVVSYWRRIRRRCTWFQMRSDRGSRAGVRRSSVRRSRSCAASGRCRARSGSRIGENGVERSGVVRAVVADHELDPVRLLAEVHDQVAGLLGGPVPGGMHCDAEDADAPGGVLDHGQDMAWVPSSRSAVKKSHARIASA